MAHSLQHGLGHIDGWELQLPAPQGVDDLASVEDGHPSPRITRGRALNPINAHQDSARVVLERFERTDEIAQVPIHDQCSLEAVIKPESMLAVLHTPSKCARA